MTQSSKGGKKTRDMLLKQDPDYYKKIGAMGGKKGKKDGVIKGFATLSPELRRELQSKGGKVKKKKS